MNLLSMIPTAFNSQQFSILHSSHAIIAGSYYLLLSKLSSHEGMIISMDQSLLPSMTLLLFVISLLLVEVSPTYSRLPNIMKHVLSSRIDWGIFSLLMFFCWVLIFDYSFDYIDIDKLQTVPLIAYLLFPIYSLTSWLILALNAIGFFDYWYGRLTFNE